MDALGYAQYFLDLATPKRLFLGSIVLSSASGIFKGYAQEKRYVKLQKIAEGIKKLVAFRFAGTGAICGAYWNYNFGIVSSIYYALVWSIGLFALTKAGVFMGEKITKIATSVFVLKKAYLGSFS